MGLDSPIIVPPEMSPEIIHLLTISEIITLHLNFADTAWAVFIIHSCVSHHNGKASARLYVLVMSRTRFRVNPHSIVAWMSIWPNGWVFVYEITVSGFESSCSRSRARIRYDFKFKQALIKHAEENTYWEAVRKYSMDSIKLRLLFEDTLLFTIFHLICDFCSRKYSRKRFELLLFFR